MNNRLARRCLRGIPLACVEIVLCFGSPNIYSTRGAATPPSGKLPELEGGAFPARHMAEQGARVPINEMTNTTNPVGASDEPLPNGPAPILWSDSSGRYRAVHFISAWDKQQGGWVRMTPDLTTARDPNGEGFGVDGITAVAKQGAAWYVGTLTGNLSVSPDGRSWQSCWRSLPDRTVSGIAISPDALDGHIAAAAFAGFATATPEAPGHVYLTTDSGRSWQDVSRNLPDEPITALRYVSLDGHQLLAAQQLGKWYVMDAKTSRWTKVPAPPQ